MNYEVLNWDNVSLKNENASLLHNSVEAVGNKRAASNDNNLQLSADLSLTF